MLRKLLIRSGGYFVIWAYLIIILTATNGGAGQNEAEVFVQLGHSESVTSVALSPDGRYLASGGLDNTICLWDIASGRQIRVFKGHSSPVESVAFSPDGRYLASGSMDATLRLLDVSSGHELRILKGHSKSVYAATFSPDGCYLASGSEDETLRLWEVSSGREIHTFKGHSGYITSVAYSPDGRYLASGNEYNTVRILELAGGRETHTFKGHTSLIQSVAFSPDGRFLASGGLDDTLRVWEISSEREVGVYKEESGGGIEIVAFSPDGRYLAAGGFLKFHLWELSGGREIRVFAENSNAIGSVAFSSDSRYLASWDSDGTICYWEIASGKKLRVFKGDSSDLVSLALSPNGRYLASANGDVILLREVSSGRLIRIINMPPFSRMPYTGEMIEGASEVLSVVFSHNGRYLASGCLDGSLRLWEVSSGREVRSFKGHSFDVATIAFSPDDRYLASGSVDTSLRLWEVSSGREIPMFQGLLHSIDPSELANFNNKNVFINTIRFSPNGQFIAYGSSDGTIRLRELSNGREVRIFEGHSGSVFSIDFSPDGHNIVSASQDKTIRLWDVSTGQEMRTFEGHSRAVNTITFSPDGHFLVSGSEDETIRLWDITTGHEVRTFNGHSNDIKSVIFSQNGQLLVSASSDTTLRLWEVSSAREIVKMISFGKEWVTITPEGFYDASSNGAKHLNVRVGNKVYGVDQFERRFYRPEIVELALAGKSLPGVETLATTFKKTAPVVKIVSPKNGISILEDEIEVKLRIFDTSGGIGDIYLYVNNTLVSTRTKSIKRRKTGSVFTFRVSMGQGENRIRAEAYNHDNSMRSNQALVIVSADYKADTPALHILSVGIDEFENDDLNLQYAVADAELFTKTIQKQSHSLFREINTTLLTRKNQTSKEKIRNAFEQIKNNIKAGDYFIFYASSHGDISSLDNSDSKYFLITSNVVFLDPENLEKTAISQDELVALIGSVQAQNKLIILDTCHAGEAGRIIQVAMADNKPVFTRALSNKTAMELLKRASGSSVFTASQSVEQAIEGYKGHGLFTWTMVEGLKNKADTDKDGYVSLSELKSYVEKTVFTRSKKYFKKKQVPYINVGSLDFSLATVE